VVEHVRARSDNAHVAFQDIEELRQLVKVCFPEETSEEKHSRVTLTALPGVAFVVDPHSAELQATERVSVESCPFLNEEHGAAALQLYYQGNDRDKEQQHDADNKAESNVEASLCCHVQRAVQHDSFH
jgi:hypothetical protein